MKFQILQLIQLSKFIVFFIAAIGVAGSKVITFEKLFFLRFFAYSAMSLETSSVCLNDFFFDSFWFNNITVIAAFRSMTILSQKKIIHNVF